MVYSMFADHIDTTTPDADLCYLACLDVLRPYEGQLFNTLNEGVKFYKEYAAACDFQPRMSTIVYADDGIVFRSHTFYAIGKEYGTRLMKSPTSSKNPKAKKRKTTSCGENCRARAIFQVSDFGFYKLRTFIEGHKHLMVPGPTRHLLPSNRKVGEIQQDFIISGIKANIGPMRTFRMFKEIVGSYDDVGCTSNDFKNFVRDLKVYNVGSNAHMLLEAFRNKQDLGNDFKFFHYVDEHDRLRRLIWSNECSVKNFKKKIGEAVSYNATHNTNRYKMIFTSFTGKDIHGKCVLWCCFDIPGRHGILCLGFG